LPVKKGSKDAHLNKLIQMFRHGQDLKVWQGMPSDTAIQPVVIGKNDAMLAVAGNLLDQGYWVGAIRPPTCRWIRRVCA
jgi:8-amino-7-oxononanoate synthase